MIQYHTIWYNLIRGNKKPYNRIGGNIAQPDTIWYNAMQHDTIRYNAQHDFGAHDFHRLFGWCAISVRVIIALWALVWVSDGGCWVLLSRAPQFAFGVMIQAPQFIICERFLGSCGTAPKMVSQRVHLRICVNYKLPKGGSWLWIDFSGIDRVFHFRAWFSNH